MEINVDRQDTMRPNKPGSSEKGKDSPRSTRHGQKGRSANANRGERSERRVKIVDPRDQKGIRPGSFPGGPSTDGCF